MNISFARTALLGVATLMGTVALAAAATPRLISYQGRLTTSNGSPVANGTYSVTFKVYTAPTGGAPVWSETNTVTTAGGLFSVVLGTVTSIPDIAVSDSGRYLALQLGPDPEMTPRRHLASVPFALNGGGWIDHGSSIGLANPSANVGIGTSSPASITGGRTLDISGGSSGSTLALRAASPGTDWELHSATIAGGAPSLEFSAPGLLAEPIVLTSRPGDSSVLLANNAVNAGEILNEPGIAVSQSAEIVEVNCSNDEQDLDTVTISIPSAGYIVVDGRCDGTVVTPLGSGGFMGGWIYVVEDTAFDQTPDHPYLSLFGYQMPVTAGSYIQFPASVSRTYYKPVGTYTFKLMGAYFGNCLDDRHANLANFVLKATFYPTSYGAVQTIVSSTEAGQFEKSQAISIPSGPDRKGPVTTRYQVDLRELELKTTRAQVEAERLQRQLAEERLRQARETSNK